MDAPPPISKESDNSISKDYVKGRLSLIKKYMYDAWGGEMVVRSNLEKIRREVKGLEEKLSEK